MDRSLSGTWATLRDSPGRLAVIALATLIVVVLAFALLTGSSPLLVFAASDSETHTGRYECTRCHSRVNPDAGIYLAVNDQIVAPGEPIALPPGDSFEVDFHFTNMVNDTARFRGVGAAMRLPAGAGWSLGIGTPAHPKEWEPGAKGDKFWSAAWDRGASGDGPSYTKWVAALDQAGAYALSFAGAPWRSTAHGMVASDRGSRDPGDRDLVANHMGADALVQIAPATAPGRYELAVIGVGHDKDGRRAHVSRSFVVQVDPAAPPRRRDQPPSQDGDRPASSDLPATAPFTPTPPSAAALYRQRCGSCHGVPPNAALMGKMLAADGQAIAMAIAEGKGNMRGFGTTKGGPLGQAEIAAIAGYLRQESASVGAAATTAGPPIIHSVRARLWCLICHDKGAMRPKPTSHGNYEDGECTVCHFAIAGGAPGFRHPREGNENCVACHAEQGGAVAVPRGHGARSVRTCVGCHQPLAATAPATGRERQSIPTIPHAIKGREPCLVCHEIDEGFLPMPDSHVGRREITCVGCHKVALRPPRVKPGAAPPGSVVLDPDAAPTFGHLAAGRELCTACHLPGSTIKPMPVGHPRDDASCLGCHKERAMPVTAAGPSAEPTATPALLPAGPGRAMGHPLESREMCTACHLPGSTTSPMPVDHPRDNELCVSCHSAPSAPAGMEQR